MYFFFNKNDVKSEEEILRTYAIPSAHSPDLVEGNKPVSKAKKNTKQSEQTGSSTSGKRSAANCNNYDF